MQKADDKAKAGKENDRPAAAPARTARSQSMVTPPTSVPAQPHTGAASHLRLEHLILTLDHKKGAGHCPVPACSIELFMLLIAHWLVLQKSIRQAVKVCILPRKQLDQLPCEVSLLSTCRRAVRQGHRDPQPEEAEL